VIAGVALLADAQVLASRASDDLSAYRAAGIVPSLRIGGGVVLGCGGLLALGGIVRYAIVARRAR
jgi:hypothetical protein